MAPLKHLRFRLAIAMLVLLLLSGCAATLPGRFAFSPYDHQLLLHLRADSETAGPHLSLDMASPSAARYAAADAAAGSAANTARLTGSAYPSVTFALRGPLDRDYYLNLSRPILGTVHWSSALLAAGGHEHFGLRVELFAGTVRIGGAQEYYDAVGGLPAWVPYNFKFRAEAPLLAKGAELSVRISRLSGVADVAIGTGGERASNLELRYFLNDPLSDAIYVRNNVLIANGGSGGEAFAPRAQAYADSGALDHLPPNSVVFLPPEAEPGTSGLAVGAFVGLAVGFGVARLGRGDRRALLAVALLLGTALAGCAGASDAPESKAAGSTTPKPTAVTTYEENAALEARGIGAINGSLKDEQGLVVKGAHIAIQGTKHFTQSDKRGLFSFPEILPGKYRLRIDATGYLFVEDEVTVQAGRVAHLNITMLRPPAGSKDFEAHRHDDWGGETKKIVQEGTVVLNSYQAQQNTAASGAWFCPGFSLCATTLPTKAAGVILPGTSLVEVKLTWNHLAGPKELQLRVVTSGNYSGDQWFVARGPGEPYRIAIFPTEADSGHKKTTNWAFYVQPPTHNSLYDLTASPVVAGQTVRFEVTIHKGVVPLEPAHRRYWNGAMELPLLQEKILEDTCPLCSFPSVAKKWDLPFPTVVPPGTKEIRGTFKWENYQGNTLATWKLVYKPANIHASEWAWKDAQKSSVSGTSFAFTIPVPPGENDPFYSASSAWAFAPGHDPPRPTGVSSSVTPYAQKWWLTATAVRDPSYEEPEPE